MKNYKTSVYIGQLDKDGKKSGIGRSMWKKNSKCDGHIFEGQFANGKRNGYGRYIFQNGNYYIGQFNNDNYEGIGKFVKQNGEVEEGRYMNDKFIGVIREDEEL